MAVLGDAALFTIYLVPLLFMSQGRGKQKQKKYIRRAYRQAETPKKRRDVFG